jgi:hypothetical protein
VFFDERRPFFTEGSQLLTSNFFYSRRIGAAPRGDAPVGDFADYPRASTILGAAKVTGRLPSGLSIVALGAVIGREYAVAFDTASRATARAEVAPLTTFGALRGLREFGANASTVGATLTWVRRDVDEGGALAAIYPRQAFGGRLDWNLRFARGIYVLGGNVGFSHVAGDATAIGRIQRSPVHYYQRPDADHVEYEASRRALAGNTASLFFEKTGGGHWLHNLSAFAESPGFDPNDAGRLGNADGRGGFARAAYRETRPVRCYNYEFGLENAAGGTTAVTASTRTPWRTPGIRGATTGCRTSRSGWIIRRRATRSRGAGPRWARPGAPSRSARSRTISGREPAGTPGSTTGGTSWEARPTG